MLRILAVLFVFSIPAQAGEFNKKLTVGDAAPVWQDLPGTDGKTHSLEDYKDKDLVVVVFTCNSCPIANDYESRINDFANRFAKPDGKVVVVAINVNTVPDDRLDKMKQRVEKKKYPFAYLYDETQKIARDFGANYTPEFFVLDKDRKIAYMGAMDDRTNEAEAKVNYLEGAVKALLADEKPTKTETLARGCMIRFKKLRD